MKSSHTQGNDWEIWLETELAAAVARTETARQAAARCWLGLGR